MDGKEIVGTWNRWDAQRSTAKSLVRQVYQYGLPRRGSVMSGQTPGADLQAELFDSTFETALERFATGLYDFMCPPGRSWRMVTPPIEHGRMEGEFGRSLLAISETLREESGKSNFPEAIYEAFLDLGSAGMATIEPSRGLDSSLEYTAHPYEQVTFAENHRGRVDSVMRKFTWTARQAVGEFGIDNVGKTIRDAYNEQGGVGRDKTFEIVHAAVPRTEFAGGTRDNLNMPVESTWVTVTDAETLRKSGWPQQRYLVCRFAKASGEKEGRSPGMTCLPDVKMVNMIEETVIVAAEHVVRPPILVPDSAFLGTVKLEPGSLLYYRVNPINAAVKPEAFISGAQPAFGVEYAESKRMIIKRAMYNDIFAILSDEKSRTATEVRGLLAEKLNLLGPNFGRLKVELFDPMTRVDLSILSEQPYLLGGIPSAVLAMANIRYTSTLALAMEYAELTAMNDAMMFLSPFAEIDPTVWDNFSFDEISREISYKMCLPPRWLKSVTEVRALREARMQQQAADAQAQMMMQVMDKQPAASMEAA